MIKYNKEFLDNSLPLILLPMKETRIVTALLMIKTGSKYETCSESGLSHFLEHMFFKGTKKRPNTLDISSALDALGGEFNAFTSKEYTGYYVKVLAGKLESALEILADMLSASKFEAEEIEREKGVIIEELNMYEDNPLMHIEDVLESCLYGNTPAGWDTIGTKETIKSFKRDDFIKYYQRQYGAKSMTLILSGAVSSADIKLANKYFSVFQPNKWRDKLRVIEAQKKPAIKIIFKKIDQVNLSLALRTFPVGHPQEMALKLLAVILGGSMSSRLFISLRERSGLAYYVRTGVESHSDTGYLSTQAGVPKNKVKSAVQIIVNEYQKIKDEGISQAELDKAKDILSGRLLMQLETSDELASWYGRQVILRQELLNPADLEKILRAVSLEDVQRVAKKIMKENNLNLALIGPIDKVAEKDIFNILKLT
ncbi:MAG: insulinase family protein [Clostridia bacterium]|nr:insulinase family protein [Clostridia bacterium]